MQKQWSTQALEGFTQTFTTGAMPLDPSGVFHPYVLKLLVLAMPQYRSGCCLSYLIRIHTHTHTHTRLTGIFPGLPRWAGTRKAKPIWILLKQETVSGSGIRWNICKSAPRSRQITMPAPHHSDTQFFLQAGCPSCRPTNSVKALKA